MRTIIAVFLMLFLDRVDFLIKFQGSWPQSVCNIITFLFVFGVISCVSQDIRELVSGKK